jgi:hypothetical protein
MAATSAFELTGALSEMFLWEPQAPQRWNVELLT